jgi:hypothetical protein
MSDKFQENVLDQLQSIKVEVGLLLHYLKNQPSHEQMKILLESTTTGPWMADWMIQRSKENQKIIQLLEIIANQPRDTLNFPTLSHEAAWARKKEDDRRKSDAEGCHMQTLL